MIGRIENKYVRRALVMLAALVAIPLSFFYHGIRNAYEDTCALPTAIRRCWRGTACQK